MEYCNFIPRFPCGAAILALSAERAEMAIVATSLCPVANCSNISGRRKSNCCHFRLKLQTNGNNDFKLKDGRGVLVCRRLRHAGQAPPSKSSTVYTLAGQTPERSQVPPHFLSGVCSAGVGGVEGFMGGARSSASFAGLGVTSERRALTGHDRRTVGSPQGSLL